jgi:hypothetical protein
MELVWVTARGRFCVRLPFGGWQVNMSAAQRIYGPWFQSIEFGWASGGQDGLKQRRRDPCVTYSSVRNLARAALCAQRRRGGRRRVAAGASQDAFTMFLQSALFFTYCNVEVWHE